MRDSPRAGRESRCGVAAWRRCSTRWRTLQGAALLVSELEREILPARIADYRPGDLDTVMASGQVVWIGVEQVGNRDGTVALYLSESLPLLLPPQELRSEVPRTLGTRERRFWTF